MNKLRITIAACALAVVAPLLNGCTVVSADRVFPKLDWYWGRDAKSQRQGRQELKQQSLERQQSQIATNTAPPSVTVIWDWRQASPLWGAKVVLEHSQDLKAWTAVTNFAAPTTGLVWMFTNQHYAVEVPRVDKDFFQVSIKP